jgi:hypothetical protein
MNIFFIDENPRKAARMVCNEHMKMILESAQMFSTLVHLTIENTDKSRIYKPCHENHPSAKWLREDLKNIDWLLKHEDELAKENFRRRGKEHKSHEVTKICYEIIKQNQHLFNLSQNITKPKLAISEQYRLPEKIPEEYYDYLLTEDVSPFMIDTVTRYRYFYVKDKRSFATWNEKPPQWFLKGCKYL